MYWAKVWVTELLLSEASSYFSVCASMQNKKLINTAYPFKFKNIQFSTYRVSIHIFKENLTECQTLMISKELSDKPLSECYLIYKIIRLFILLSFKY